MGRVRKMNQPQRGLHRGISAPRPDATHVGVEAINSHPQGSSDFVGPTLGYTRERLCRSSHTLESRPGHKQSCAIRMEEAQRIWVGEASRVCDLEPDEPPDGSLDARVVPHLDRLNSSDGGILDLRGICVRWHTAAGGVTGSRGPSEEIPRYLDGIGQIGD